jgi:hypothetical protein
MAHVLAALHTIPTFSHEYVRMSAHACALRYMQAQRPCGRSLRSKMCACVQGVCRKRDADMHATHACEVHGSSLGDVVPRAWLSQTCVRKRGPQVAVCSQPGRCWAANMHDVFLTAGLLQCLSQVTGYLTREELHLHLFEQVARYTVHVCMHAHGALRSVHAK